MKLSRSWTLTLTITFVVILWMFSGLFIEDDSQTSLSEEIPTSKQLDVRIETSVAEPMTNRFILQGQTLAKRKVTLKAETSGVVSNILFDRGDTVEAGTKLLQLAVDIRDARLVEAKSSLAEREAQFAAAQSLKQEGFQAEIEIAKAKAALDSAKTMVTMAELELQRINIQAPISGIVNTRFVEIGDYVAPGDPMLVVVDLNPIRIVGQVSERYLGEIQVGKAGEVRLLDNTVVKASVSFVGAVASENTRTFPVEMEIPNPRSEIIEGITAELRLPIKQVMAHKIPPSSLSLLDNGTLSIKAVNNESVVVAYPIQILGETKDGIWLGGLPSTLSIITVGHEFVKPGEKVLAVNN